MWCWSWSPRSSFVLVVGASAAAAAPAIAVWHGPTDRPRVALTFDDSFNLPYAPRTVQAMIDAGLKATVFVMAQDVNAHPDVARMIAQGGFEIGDHTVDHLLLTALPYGVMLNEIGAGARRVRPGDRAPDGPVLPPALRQEQRPGAARRRREGVHARVPLERRRAGLAGHLGGPDREATC